MKFNIGLLSQIQTSKLIFSILPAMGIVFTASADPVIIDSFDDGTTFTLSNTSGTASYNYLGTAPDILGGRRQVRTRAGGSGFYGPSVIMIDVSTDRMSSYGGDAGDRFLQYGSAIGTQTFTGAGPGSPVDLNLHLTLESSLNFDVYSAATGGSVAVSLFAGDGAVRNANINIGVGESGIFSIPLTSFTGLTVAEAADIDGISISPNSTAGSASQGLVLNEVSFEAVPEPSSFAFAGMGLAAGAVMWIRKVRASRA